MSQKGSNPLVRLNFFSYWQLEELAKVNYGALSTYLAILIQQEFNRVFPETSIESNPILRSKRVLLEAARIADRAEEALLRNVKEAPKLETCKQAASDAPRTAT